MKYSIPIFVLIMLLGYAIGSFVMLDWNPGNWEFIDRLVTACIVTFLALAIASANYR